MKKAFEVQKIHVVKRGRMVYVPNDMLNEILDLQAEHRLNSRQEAFRKAKNYTRVGRELERIMKFDFGWKPTKDIPMEKRKKIKGLFEGGLF